MQWTIYRRLVVIALLFFIYFCFCKKSFLSCTFFFFFSFSSLIFSFYFHFYCYSTVFARLCWNIHCTVIHLSRAQYDRIIIHLHETMSSSRMPKHL
ncbi:uncharacterized protein EURHEDRAFT_355492 [Aspergillus ruber CBS 135680]|uniref:Uncharacterized protein n=1 Tax=Aspergillus ruber (strain CBS 135680) TaxID=1388766 RepID=A0A017SIK3_ASPRC|nr:uncharacterized protein EURHEDRAFT_355492 [Aspergillus ruber CBS 135680]EYE96551.1 hypothetical protein EURHEDRAFT_355492 [Aspergillus ruber CBS 135680]